jgi:hypothetical protein
MLWRGKVYTARPSESKGNYTSRPRESMYASGRQNIDQGDAPLHSHCCKLHTQASLGSDSSHSSQQHSAAFDTVALAAVATISGISV